MKPPACLSPRNYLDALGAYGRGPLGCHMGPGLSPALMPTAGSSTEMGPGSSRTMPGTGSSSHLEIPSASCRAARTPLILPYLSIVVARLRRRSSNWTMRLWSVL